MATYYVNSGAGGAATGADWTNAFLTIGAALTAATTDGDVVRVHKTHQEEIAADANGVLTFGASIALICVDKDASDALSPMGTGGWFGNSTLNRSIVMTAVNRKVFIYGLTLRTAGATGDGLYLSAGDGAHFEYEDCYLWQGNTNAGLHIYTGSGATNSDLNTYARFLNCTFRFGNVAQYLALAGRVAIEGGSIASAGSAITTVARPNPVADVNATDVQFSGFDFSNASATATLVGDAAIMPFTVRLSQCKLPSGAFTWLGSQTHANLSSAELYVVDCDAGDTHGLFGYHNALGSLTSDTNIKYTSGAAGQSWKIATTSAAGFFSPFRTPWISLYHSGTSAITPRFEVLRDGNATAFENDEVWADFLVKTTSTSTMGTLYSDRMALLGTPAAQASGTDTWDGENATHWAGKVDSGSAVTPAEAGDIRGRVCVGLASTTVYVDPFIRT